jgi:hypothetical protein
MQIDSTMLITVIAAVIALLALVALAARFYRHRRSAALREHFGAEYERALAQHGDRVRAEEELMARRKRMRRLQIRPLSSSQRERFDGAWSEVQQRFIDDPAGAVLDAHTLVKQVLNARGYAVDDFEQCAADLSVEHAGAVDHYRAARETALASARGEASTEDLRQALVHFRALFGELLNEPQPAGRLSEAPA